MKIGVVVDNEFNNDVRVRKEVELLRAHYDVVVLCFSFDGKTYEEVEGIKVQRVEIKRFIKNTLFFFFYQIPFLSKPLGA